MALSEVGFRRAIDGFAAVARRGSWSGDRDRAHHVQGWSDVKVTEKFGTSYLRITRRLPAQALSTNSNGNTRRESEGAENIAEIEEDDPEALMAPPAASQERALAVLYDIIHSPSYQVPVLYLTFANAHSNKSVPLHSPDETYELLVPNDFKAPMREVGVMGALSMAEHPITGMPAYFVHPCRTPEAMAPLTRDIDFESGDKDPVEYLMLWLGAIGASVGLSVPLDVAKLFADRCGDAR